MEYVRTQVYSVSLRCSRGLDLGKVSEERVSRDSFAVMVPEYASVHARRV